MLAAISPLLTSSLLNAPKLTNKRMHVVEGLSPEATEQWEFHLERSKITYTASISTGAAKELGTCVPSVLNMQTAVVFQGLREDGHQEGLCYLGRPLRKFTKTGIEIASNQDELFLVFINECRIIYHWRWEWISMANVNNLIGKRFGRRIR